MHAIHQMIIKKVTRHWRRHTVTGYAIWLESSKEYSPMFKTMMEAIRMAMRVGL